MERCPNLPRSLESVSIGGNRSQSANRWAGRARGGATTDTGHWNFQISSGNRPIAGDKAFFLPPQCVLKPSCSGTAIGSELPGPVNRSRISTRWCRERFQRSSVTTETSRRVGRSP